MARIHECYARDGVWFVPGYHEVSVILRDQSSFGKRFEHSSAGVPDGELADSMRRWFVFDNPPRHTTLRTAFLSALYSSMTPAVTELRTTFIMDRLLNSIAGRGSADIVHDFALPLVTHLFCDMLSLSAAEREPFLVLGRAPNRVLDLVPPLTVVEAEEGNIYIRRLNEMFRELIGSRIRRPVRSPNDPLTYLGRHTNVDPPNILANLCLLFMAARETTTSLISSGVWLLLLYGRWGEQQNWSKTVAEVCRFEPPVQYTSRTALKSVWINDSVVPKGAPVIALIAAANRDPSAFSAPDVFDPNCSRPYSHISFGAGIHHCFGARIATVAAQTALGLLARRIPNMCVSGYKWGPEGNLRGLNELHVNW